MSFYKKSNVLSILQPDLLAVEELVNIIESRCCWAENLRLLPKEGLVGLFRRVVLPLPQRLYRTNRRGKMLTARRARAGLGNDRNEEGSAFGLNGRLKSPPDIYNSHRSRMNCGSKCGETNRGHSGGVKDKRSLCSGDEGAETWRNDGENSRCESPSGRRITLKRLSSGPETPPSETPPPTDSKRQRTAIKWP